MGPNSKFLVQPQVRKNRRTSNDPNYLSRGTGNVYMTDRRAGQHWAGRKLNITILNQLHADGFFSWGEGMGTWSV